MTSPERATKAETEAAAWHGRLGARVVSTDTIDAFFTWRKDPDNAEAYRRIEAIWGAASGLKGDPDIAEAVRTVGLRPRTGSLPAWMGLAVAAAACAVLAIGVGLHQRSRGELFETRTGEGRLVRLAEGSTVRLDTASRIRVRYDGSRRLVDLEAGQAMFTVAHETRPFLVRAGQAEVTALGTVFDVRRDNGRISVVLVSGRVEVKGASGTAGTRAVRLSPGQKSEVIDGGLKPPSAVDVSAETGWTEGRLIFRDTPLREAVVEVNRYLAAPLSLDAPALAETPVNGVFEAGDKAAFVGAVQTLFGLEAHAAPDGTTRLASAK